MDNPDRRDLVLLDPWMEQYHVDEELDLSKMSLESKGSSSSRTYHVSLSCALLICKSVLGLFGVSWDMACTIFDGLYLSWDPQLFSHQLMFHG